MAGCRGKKCRCIIPRFALLPVVTRVVESPGPRRRDCRRDQVELLFNFVDRPVHARRTALAHGAIAGAGPEGTVAARPTGTRSPRFRWPAMPTVWRRIFGAYGGNQTDRPEVPPGALTWSSRRAATAARGARHRLCNRSRGRRWCWAALVMHNYNGCGGATSASASRRARMKSVVSRSARQYRAERCAQVTDRVRARRGPGYSDRAAGGGV